VSGRDDSAFTRGFAARRPGRAQTLPLSAELALFVAACLLMTAATVAPAAERTVFLPSAADEVRLRSACAASGEQILAGNTVRRAVYQEQFSRYSARTNRCYVEMRVQTLADDERADRFGRFFYDGQTKELLAFAEIKNGKKSGRVFDLNHRIRSFANDGFDDAAAYIDAMMTGDR
jgi:hypothetical protein